MIQKFATRDAFEPLRTGAYSKSILEEYSMRQRSDYPTFSDAELQRRHQAFYGLMEQEGVDAALMYGGRR